MLFLVALSYHHHRNETRTPFLGFILITLSSQLRSLLKLHCSRSIMGGLGTGKDRDKGTKQDTPSTHGLGLIWLLLF